MVGSKQLQSINFMLFFNNPIFLRKFPLIKLQRFWQTGQAKINNSSKYHSMVAIFIFRGFFKALPISAVSQRSTLCPRVLVKIPQPISGFWDLSACPKWLLPEPSIPAAGQKDRRLWGRDAPVRALDLCRRPERSWALGTRMVCSRTELKSDCAGPIARAGNLGKTI